MPKISLHTDHICASTDINFPSVPLPTFNSDVVLLFRSSIDFKAILFNDIGRALTLLGTGQRRPSRRWHLSQIIAQQFAELKQLKELLDSLPIRFNFCLRLSSSYSSSRAIHASVAAFTELKMRCVIVCDGLNRIYCSWYFALQVLRPFALMCPAFAARYLEAPSNLSSIALCTYVSSFCCPVFGGQYCLFPPFLPSICSLCNLCLLFSLSLSRFDTLTVDLISHLDI